MLWGLKQVEPQVTYGLAVDFLRGKIHSGLLLPAEKLPAERQLSERFGISRVSLREALRVLEANQYITVRRGAKGGAFVADEDRLSELARHRLSRAPGDTMRVVEFLTVNQMAVARLAATRRGPAELKRIREALGMLRTACTAPQVKQAEALFLLALGDAAHNPLLASAIEDGLAELFLPFEFNPAHETGAAALRLYDCLFSALEAEDASGAEAAMADLHELLWDVVRRSIRTAA